MNARSLAILLAAGLALSACRSSRPAPPSGPPPAGPEGGVPAPPAPAPPSPVVTPEPTPGATQVDPGTSAPGPAASIPGQSAPPPAPAASRPYQDVLRLKQSGLSDEFILNKVRSENLSYQLTTAEILELRAAGVSETVLEAMLRSGQAPAAVAGTPMARRAEFAGLARVGKGFLGIFGTSAKDFGRLVVDGEKIAWYEADEPDENFALFVRNIKEIFNTCVLRPGQNLCLELGLVTYTGDVHRFRDPGWKNGENRLVLEATDYFRREFPSLFFTQRAVNKL